MEKYAPYILIISGGLIVALSFFGGGAASEGYIGLLFMALGAGALYMKNKKV